MALRDDIEDGERLEQITVRVIEAEKMAGSTQSWRITVEDTAGQDFEVKIWGKHGSTTRWQEGIRYVLEQGIGSRWGETVILHSSQDFRVRSPSDAVDFLVMSDTHIGREQRTEETIGPYHTARQFIVAAGYASRYSVDAVLHGGDFFDDNPSAIDLELARNGLDILRRSEIPFYYVHGNHGVTTAADVLTEDDRIDISHLDEAGVRISEGVDLYGADYSSATESSISAANFEMGSDSRHDILVTHQDLDRFQDGTSSTESLPRSPEQEFDYVLSGHIHDPRGESCGVTEIQYLGSTAAISTNSSSMDQSAWLLRADDDGISISRLSLE